MSTQFGDKYRKWARVTKAIMRIQLKPRDAIQVDWAGDTIPVYDSVTGERSSAYLFVSVLPCSCYVYAEACDDMKTENWLNCHVHAFNYFGGAARLLILDNCKTATTSNTRYETVLNRSYQELADYYNTAIVYGSLHKLLDTALELRRISLVWCSFLHRKTPYLLDSISYCLTNGVQFTFCLQGLFVHFTEAHEDRCGFGTGCSILRSNGACRAAID